MPRPALWADHPALRAALLRSLTQSDIPSLAVPPETEEPEADAARLCSHCQHYWASYRSEFCPFCEVLYWHACRLTVILIGGRATA
jgi:hypothetical protein